MEVYKEIERAVRCLGSNTVGTGIDWIGVLKHIRDKNLPHGLGFDVGCDIVLNPPKGKIVIHTSYHHMDENGYYCGWTDHDIVIFPDWQGIDFRITGRNYRNIKEYIGEVFAFCLNEEIEIDLSNFRKEEN